MRTFGVEEELLVVDADTWRPLASGEGMAAQAVSTGPHRLMVEIQQEQVEVVGPPCATLSEQLATIHRGRFLADKAARAVGGRAVALATPVWPGLPNLVPDERYLRIRQHVGLLADEQLTCGFGRAVHGGRWDGLWRCSSSLWSVPTASAGPTPHFGSAGTGTPEAGPRRSRRWRRRAAGLGGSLARLLPH